MLDSIFGELSPAETARLDAAVAATPGPGAERDRLTALLDRERAAQAEALSSVLDAKAAERMAARIVDRVRRDEDRHVEVSGRRRFWARFLAISVAAHVVAIGVFSYRHFHGPDAERSARPDAGDRRIAWAPETSDGAPSMDRPFAADPLEGALPGYRLDGDEVLPVEPYLEKSTTGDADPALSARPLGMARAMWVRTSDPMKRLIEARVGSAGTLDRVKSSLAALAKVQADDGSFADRTGNASTRATATVLLAFLSDGHSSRGGAHRAVVERGVAWLSDRADDPEAPAGDRALALLALAEDVLLSSGDLTPAEARFRIHGLAPLASRVQSAVQTAAASRDGGRAGTDARWSDLALAAAARAGALRGTTVATVTIDPSTVRPADDVRTAMLDGTTLLKDRRGTTFKAWNAETARTLGARLGADGLIVGTAKPAARAEETALVLLALEVAYRTY